MKFSLRKKTAILIILIAVILSSTAIFVSGTVISNMVDEQFSLTATNIARTIAASVDVNAVKSSVYAVKEIYDASDNRVGSDEWGTPEFDEYVGVFSQISEEDYFKAVLEQLRNIQNANDVDCVYILYVDVPSESTVYVVDAAMEDACPPGCFDPLYDMNKQLLTNPEVGFPAYITKTDEYGWLVTAGVPIYDEDGNVLCYAMVDVSMDEIRANQSKFINTIVIILVILTILISVIAMLVVDKTVVKPINILSNAASKYCEEKDMTQARLGFGSLDIHTGDEIEILSESMKRMEREINDNIANLLVATEELTNTRIKADIMNELATKDALTGVRNKMSYDIEVDRLSGELTKGNTEFGIAMIDLNFLKKINDNYGHEKGNIAIQKLCHIICSTFVHSPVFRVGGDEFVTILQNTDYQNVKELVESFNTIIDDLSNDLSLEPWERVSAAIGYALFDSRRDVSVEDVFKRADGEMYIRKKEMKSIMV